MSTDPTSPAPMPENSDAEAPQASAPHPDTAQSPAPAAPAPGSAPAAPATAPKKRSPWPWVLGGGCLLVVLGAILALILAVTGIVNLAKHDEQSAGGITTPSGVAEGQAYIQFGDGAESDTIVDVYSDYLCPYCKQFSDANGEDLKAMAHDDAYTVRMHVRPMLDTMSSPQGYSGRAANAALAVYDEDPELFWAMDEELFANQPGEGEEGLSDEKLIELAHTAGASDAVDQKITDGTYIPYLEDVVEPEAKAKDYGTPTIEVNGKLHEADDLYTPGSLKAAVEAAA